VTAGAGFLRRPDTDQGSQGGDGWSSGVCGSSSARCSRRFWNRRCVFENVGRGSESKHKIYRTYS